MTPVTVLLALGLALGQLSPLETYQRDFHGEYAPKGACERATERWSFRDRDLVEGQVFCQVSEVMEASGTTVLKTHGCTRNGASIPPRTYRLDLMSADVVKARVGETTMLLERCSAR